VADVLVLDASASYNFGGLVATYEWQYALFLNGTFGAQRSLSTPQFADAFTSANSVVTIETTALPLDTPVQFSLRVWRPNVTADTAPTPSSTVRAVVTRRDRALIKATVTPPAVAQRAVQCQETATVLGLCGVPAGDGGAVGSGARHLLANTAHQPPYEFQWTQTGGPSLATAKPDPAWWRSYRLLFDAFLLDTFATYAFSVSITSTGDVSIAAATGNVTFSVQPSTPVADIAGNDAYRQVEFSDPLALDASQSFDADYSERGVSQLRFAWLLPTLMPATPVASDCVNDNNLLSDRMLLLDRASPTLTVPPGFLYAGLQYEFKLLVSHASAPVAFTPLEPGRAFVVVVVKAAPLPPTTASVVHQLRVDIAHVDAAFFSVAAFPVTEKLRLQASVRHTTITYASTGAGVVVETARSDDVHETNVAADGFELVYRWEETHAFVDARDAATLLAPPDKSALVLPAGALSSAWAPPLTYRLTAQLLAADGSVLATDSNLLDVTVNAAPTVVAATVSPTTGVAGTTHFQLRCEGAADVDEPLRYQFAYIAASTTTPTPPVVYTLLTARIDVKSTRVYLPRGDFVVVCYAFDALGAQSLPSAASSVVSVTALPAVVAVGVNGTCTLSPIVADRLAPSLVAAQSLSATLQQVNSLYSSIVAAQCASAACSVFDALIGAVVTAVDAAIVDDELTDTAVQMTSETLATLTNTALAICPSSFDRATQVIVAMLGAVKSAKNCTTSCLSPANAAKVLASIGDTLSSLIVGDSCAQFDAVSGLVTDLVSTAGAGSVTGEQVAGIDTDEIKATTTRVDGTGATAATTGATFDLPAGAFANTATPQCANVQIVEFDSATARACRGGDADTAAVAAGIDVPVSNVVSADVYDCDGNLVSVRDLATPISFLIPFEAALLAPTLLEVACPAATDYLPSNGIVSSQTQQVTTQAQCNYFDEDAQVWTDDGCVVADANVTLPSGKFGIRCECTHLTEFAILLRSVNNLDVTACNNNPASVFGSIVFLIFACLYMLMLSFAARQTYFAWWAFSVDEQYTMKAQHTLLCVICIFRIVVCVIYFLLQFESVRVKVEFKAVATLSGIPYILMLWLFSLLVSNWAAIYSAARRSQLHNMQNAFRKLLPYFVAGNALVSLLLLSVFVTIAVTSDSELRTEMTLVGSVVYATLSGLLGLSFARFGYGLLIVLSKDFASKSASRLCKVGAVFASCFVGEASIWLVSAVAPDAFFAYFEMINSIFFSLDLLALLCVLAVTYRTLREAVDEKRERKKKMRNMLSRANTFRSLAPSRAEPSSPRADSNAYTKAKHFFAKSRRGSIVSNSSDDSKSNSRRGSSSSAGASATRSAGASWMSRRGSLESSASPKRRSKQSSPRSSKKSSRAAKRTISSLSKFKRQMRRRVDIKTKTHPMVAKLMSKMNAVRADVCSDVFDPDDGGDVAAWMLRVAASKAALSRVVDDSGESSVDDDDENAVEESDHVIDFTDDERSASSVVTFDDASSKESWENGSEASSAFTGKSDVSSSSLSSLTTSSDDVAASNSPLTSLSRMSSLSSRLSSSKSSLSSFNSFDARRDTGTFAKHLRDNLSALGDDFATADYRSSRRAGSNSSSSSISSSSSSSSGSGASDVFGSDDSSLLESGEESVLSFDVDDDSATSASGEVDVALFGAGGLAAYLRSNAAGSGGRGVSDDAGSIDSDGTGFVQLSSDVRDLVFGVDVAGQM
jgi:hypothetical protein